VVGSALAGQAFKSERWFQGRPSAAAYDPRAAAGSNLAPSNPALRERAAAASAAIAAREGVSPERIPADLLTASGSGLDPHLSPAAALLQVPRIARARGLDEAQIRALVASHTEGRWLGLYGAPRVHLLHLNLALDALSPRL
jgi:K+-transporting ATPase ATPase C chain